MASLRPWGAIETDLRAHNRDPEYVAKKRAEWEGLRKSGMPLLGDAPQKGIVVSNESAGAWEKRQPTIAQGRQPPPREEIQGIPQYLAAPPPTSVPSNTLTVDHPTPEQPPKPALTRLAEKEHQGAWEAFKGGLRDSSGAADLRWAQGIAHDYLPGLVDKPTSRFGAEPQGAVERIAHGAGEMVASPYLLATLGLGPVGAAAGMGAEAIHQSLDLGNTEEPISNQDLLRAGKAGAINAGIGALTGVVGHTVGEAATPVIGETGAALAKIPAEAGTMGTAGEAVQSYEQDRPFSPANAVEGSLEALPVVGGAHAVAAGFRRLGGAPKDVEATPEDPAIPDSSQVPPPETPAQRLLRLQREGAPQNNAAAIAAQYRESLRAGQRPAPAEMPPAGEQGAPVESMAGQTVAGPGAPEEIPGMDAWLAKQEAPPEAAPPPQEPAIEAPPEAGVPPPPQPEPSGAQDATPAPTTGQETGTPEGVPEAPAGEEAPPPPPEMAPVTEQGHKYQKQADEFFALAQAASERGDWPTATRMLNAQERALNELEKMGGTQPVLPEVPPEGAPEQKPAEPEVPPEVPPEAQPEAAVPPVTEPVTGNPATDRATPGIDWFGEGAPPEKPKSRAQKLVEAIRASRPQEPEPVRPTPEILKAAREPIPFKAEDDYSATTEPIRGEYRTPDMLLEEIQREQRAIQQQEAGAPVDEKWVDNTLSINERKARIADLTKEIQERQGLPAPVQDVLSGERQIFVQAKGESPEPLRKVAERYGMGHEEIGPYEVLYNPDGVSPQEVKALHDSGDLFKLYEPDVKWAARPSTEGTPSKSRNAEPPKNRASQRGSLFGKKKPKPDWFRLKDPETGQLVADESRFLGSRPGKTAMETLRAVHEHLRALKGEFFGFEDEVHPRHFVDDPWLGGKKNLGKFKEHVEDLELAKSWFPQARAKATKEIGQVFQPVLTNHEHFEAAWRVIDMSDRLMDAERGIGPKEDMEKLKGTVEALLQRSPPAVHETLRRYIETMKRVVDKDIARGWLSEKTREITAYVPRYFRDMTNAALEQYQGVSRALGEGASKRWQIHREGGEYAPWTGEEFLHATEARLIAHEMLMKAEDHGQKWIPWWDVLPHMKPSERERIFTSADTEIARKQLHLGQEFQLKGPDGKTRQYVAIPDYSPRKHWPLPPTSEPEAGIMDAMAVTEGKSQLYLVPKRVGQKYQQFFRSPETSIIGRDMAAASGAMRTIMVTAPGTKFLYRNVLGDMFNFWYDMKPQEAVELAKVGIQLGMKAPQIGTAVVKWGGENALRPFQKLVGKDAPYVPLEVTQHMPDVWRAYRQEVPESEPELKKFQDLLYRQAVPGSGFMGDPRGSQAMDRLIEQARGPGHHGNPAMRGGKWLLREYNTMNQDRESFLRVLSAKANFERMQTGRRIRSFSIDTEGLIPEYQIGKIARGLMVNYTRLSPKFQSLFRDKIANFLTYSTGSMSLSQYRFNEVFRGVIHKDLAPVANAVVKLGLPLYAADQMRKKWPELWAHLQSAGGWQTDYAFSFPLAEKDKDGNQRIFVPSTSFDIWQQAINFKDLGKHIQQYRQGEINKKDLLIAMLTDPMKGLGNVMADTTTQWGQIPYGLVTNRDLYAGGRKIVPDDDVANDIEGIKMKAAWAAGQVLSFVNATMADAKRAARLPGGTAVGGPSRIWEALRQGPLDLNPKDTFTYPVDPEGLTTLALLEQGRVAEVETKSVLMKAESAALAEELGDPGPMKELEAQIDARMDAGKAPPSDKAWEKATSGPRLQRRLQETENWQAKTPAEREKSRLDLRDLVAQMHQDQWGRYQKTHPGAAETAQEQVMQGEDAWNPKSRASAIAKQFREGRRPQP